MSRKMLRGCLVVGALVGAPAAISAAPIAIQNPSFETPVADPDSGFTPNGTPVDGWVASNPFNGGLWDIGAFSYSFWSVPAPDGNQIIYMGQPNTPTFYTQTLVDTLQANTIYSLTGFVGADIGFVVPYTVELRAGNNVVASVTGTGPEGTFALFSVPFDSTGSPHVGLPLGIRLLSSGSQTGFDDVHLDASPVPEPTTLLLALGGIVALICRKTAKRNSVSRVEPSA